MRNLRRDIMIGICAITPLLGAAAFSGTAFGFNDFVSWGGTAHGPEAGADFIFGTGGAQEWGVTCAMCHINDNNQQGQIALTVTPTPAWGMVNGAIAYKPGQKYDLAIAMTGEHLGSGMTNLNSFALTVEDQNGKLAGVIASDACQGGPQSCASSANCSANVTPINQLPAQATTYTFGPTCSTVFSIPRKTGSVTQWKMSWTAPAAGSGKVTAFYGAVDGDGKEPLTSKGDDVIAGTVKLEEGT